jgi:hypothetical protein
MPADVTEIHEALRRELVYLYTKWNDFKLLFCTTDENFRLLFSVAEFFFSIIREVLRDDIILTVCRLSDPANSRVESCAVN